MSPALVARGLLAAAMLAVAGCGPAGEGPEGTDLSYNPDQHQPYHPENAEHGFHSYSYPNGWVRLWIATSIHPGSPRMQQQAVQNAAMLYQRATDIARERNQAYIALIGARSIQVDRVTKDQLGIERARTPDKIAADILVAFRSTPGRGWVKANEFAALTRR
jgi:hypothetical protein